MTYLTTLDFLDLFNFYLILSFVMGTAFRLRNYRSILGLLYRFANRWPKLLELTRESRGLFLRWPTAVPIPLALLLALVNGWASWFVWPHARVSFGDLKGPPLALVASLSAGALMCFLD